MSHWTRFSVRLTFFSHCYQQQYIFLIVFSLFVSFLLFSPILLLFSFSSRVLMLSWRLLCADAVTWWKKNCRYSNITFQRWRKWYFWCWAIQLRQIRCDWWILMHIGYIHVCKMYKCEFALDKCEFKMGKPPNHIGKERRTKEGSTNSMQSKEKHIHTAIEKRLKKPKRERNGTARSGSVAYMYRQSVSLCLCTCPT